VIGTRSGSRKLAKKKAKGVTGAEANIKTGKQCINGILPNWVLNAWNETSSERIAKGERRQLRMADVLYILHSLMV
jgi:hypothetical protein